MTKETGWALVTQTFFLPVLKLKPNNTFGYDKEVEILFSPVRPSIIESLFIVILWLQTEMWDVADIWIISKF